MLGGGDKFYSYEKRGEGGEKGVSHAGGGHKKFWGSFKTQEF